MSSTSSTSSCLYSLGTSEPSESSCEEDQLRVDPVSLLPSELLNRVFEAMSWIDLSRCRCVSRQWRYIASDEVLWRKTCPRIGAKEWSRIGLEVVESSIPRNIVSLLKSPCPISKGCMLLQTHRLVYFPPDMTLNRLRSVSGIDFSDYSAVERAYGDRPIGEDSGWVLVTRKVIEGTRNKTAAEQKSVVRQLDYTPLKAVYAVACMLLEPEIREHYEEGYTRCAEIVEGEGHIMVGGAWDQGLDVTVFDGIHPYCGIGAYRKV